METTDLFFRFGVAAATGFLIGLQRESVHGKPKNRDAAGIRTFMLFSIGGCAAALLANSLEMPLIFAAIFLVYGALIVVSYVITTSKKHVGMTTEIGAFAAIMLGAMCYCGYMLLAVALAVIVTGLLSLKIEMHRFARKMRREDLFATLKFAVITAVVLPLLPNQNFGPPPFDIFNPYSTWLMVVFISAISFSGYLLIKILGPRLGIGLTGFLGGMVSSMAVTLGFTQRSLDEESLSNTFALGIVISWTTMYVRIGVILAVLNAHLLQRVWLALLILVLVGLVFAIFMYLHQKKHDYEYIRLENPFSLQPAIRFGLIYVVILVIAKASQIYLGDAGVYLSSITAGFVDLSAITISLADLSTSAQALSLSVAGRGIILAALTNNLVKGGIAVTSGSKSLRKLIIPVVLIWTIVSIGVALWIV